MNRVEMAAWQKDRDARALDAAARVMRRRVRGRRPAGVALAAFCRELTDEATRLRAEAEVLREGAR